ncbi:GerAB/ArcD/ProY family transporter [Paenibacillus macerans]|nr:GerAB/ArcD/ProY family transporter [Paenibacillus macerans]MCY7556733.1 GerAB/ArcD/ProY family transporter [Paenibacillus macerans]MEC0153096.1 GerAB/ArcD/ProY family transporter [Paenibacillus macerans]
MVEKGKISAGRDLWLSPVHLAGIAFVLAMLQLGRMFPGETSIAYSKRVLEKLPGKAAGLIIVFYTAYLTSVILRIYSDFISSVFLENSPSLVTAGGIMFLVAYAVRGGGAGAAGPAVSAGYDRSVRAAEYSHHP